MVSHIVRSVIHPGLLSLTYYEDVTLHGLGNFATESDPPFSQPIKNVTWKDVSWEREIHQSFGLHQVSY